LERIVLHATSLRIPIVEVEGGSLTALAGFDGHQGVALVVEPRQFATIDEVLARAVERGEPPFVLVLDSLEDPHNVGSLLRSAEGAGVHGVLFPVRRQAPLTPSAIKASAGAVEHLLLCPVDDLASALADLHGHGVWVAGADSAASLTARQTDLRGPIAIVVGSEGQGLGPAVRKRCDLFVRIPLKGAIGSLNAAVAGSVLLFEVAAQRDPEGTAPRLTARNVLSDSAAATTARSASEPTPSPDLVPPPPPVRSASRTKRPTSTPVIEVGSSPPSSPASSHKSSPKPKAKASAKPKAGTKATSKAEIPAVSTLGAASSTKKAKASAKGAKVAKPKGTANAKASDAKRPKTGKTAHASDPATGDEALLP
jgi:23S rRNA (guanosine2251-2'-O)-methyltransferase